MSLWLARMANILREHGTTLPYSLDSVHSAQRIVLHITKRFMPTSGRLIAISARESLICYARGMSLSKVV